MDLGMFEFVQKISYHYKNDNKVINIKVLNSS